MGKDEHKPGGKRFKVSKEMAALLRAWRETADRGTAADEELAEALWRAENAKWERGGK